MQIRAFGIRATIVLRDEFLSWKVLGEAKSMGTAGVGDAYVIIMLPQFVLRPTL